MLAFDMGLDCSDLVEKVVNSVNEDRARGKSGLHAGNDEQSAFFVWRGRLVKRSSIG